MRFPVILLLLLLALNIYGQETLKLSYVGNMGILLSTEKNAVMIDGLHTYYSDDYLFPPKTLLRDIQTNYNPTLLLFTHLHGDHFSKELAEQYLKKTPNARLIAAPEVTEQLKLQTPQIISVRTEHYKKQFFTHDTVDISVFRMNHKNPRHKKIQNLGFIITMAGKKILHVGDTGWFQEIAMFQKLSLADEQIDIAILPYWMLLHQNAKANLKNLLNPKQLVVTHISPRINLGDLKRLKRAFPNAIFFTELEDFIEH